MLRRRSLAASLLVLSSLVLAVPLSPPPSAAIAVAAVRADDGPYVKLPAEKEARPNRYFTLKASTNCKAVKWIIPAGLEQLDPAIPLADKLTLVLIGDTGSYKVSCYGALGDQASEIATCTVTIGTPTPPEPPTPPTPPEPPPSPAPIPAAGLRVLVFFDPATAAALPEPQKDILYGQATRDYLNQKTVLGADGKTHEWRIWPSSVQTAGETQLWIDAARREKKSLPWVIISNGKSGFEGALPATPAEFQTLVEKYTQAPRRKAA